MAVGNQQLRLDLALRRSWGGARLVAEVERSWPEARERGRLRLVHYSIE